MKMQSTVITLLILAFCFLIPAVVDSGVPVELNDDPEDLGLYDKNDRVIVLTETNFNSSVLGQDYACLVEFYNSYCGHCKRFAPFYKELANQTWPWRQIIKIMAVDCAAEDNNAICREYEIMAYPTLRYFKPQYQVSSSDYGRKFDSQNIDVIRSTLALLAANETQTKNIKSWPNFTNISKKESNFEELFATAPPTAQQIIIVFEPKNKTIGLETILNFLQYPEIQVRRITDAQLAKNFGIESDGPNRLSAINRKGKITSIQIKEVDSILSYKNSLASYLQQEHITERPTEKPTTEINKYGQLINADNMAYNTKKILEEVKKNKHLVYQADLEMALLASLSNEIPKVNNISGERLSALQRFMNVINRYNPLGDNGKLFIAQLYDFVMQNNEKITGEEFSNEYNSLKKKFDPIFSSSKYVGCLSSKSNLRGVTCSLWQLFHYLTVQASESNKSNDPLEVLHAMHGYVKYFFGCADCSEHFQKMSAHMWSTPTKDEAILWLWSAHNKVNKRLAGDETEDPLFPKIQFPSIESCSSCYRDPQIKSTSNEISWNKVEVLNFLKNIHHPDNISHYQVEHEEILLQSLEHMRQKPLIANVFSVTDMRMGIFLYGTCIVMMVIAFKLFVFKGYRKKSYNHDSMGKV